MSCRNFSIFVCGLFRLPPKKFITCFFPCGDRAQKKEAGEEISVSFDLGVLDTCDHMKTFFFDLSLSDSRFFSFWNCSSSINIFVFEPKFSWWWCLLTVHQLFSEKFHFFHELCEFFLVFHFACLPPKLLGFEISCVLLMFGLKILICWWIKLVL